MELGSRCFLNTCARPCIYTMLELKTSSMWELMFRFHRFLSLFLVVAVGT